MAKQRGRGIANQPVLNGRINAVTRIAVLPDNGRIDRVVTFDGGFNAYADANTGYSWLQIG